MKPIERLKLFIRHKGLSQSAFELRIGVGNGYIGKHLKKKGSIGSDILEKICAQFKELNPTWLLTGSGSMLLDETTMTNDIEELISKTYTPEEKTAFIKILDELSIEKIIAYVHDHEKSRGFDKNPMYKMFLKIRTQRQVIETLEDMEARYRKVILELKKRESM